MRHYDFFAMCRSPEMRDLAPFPERLELQCRLQSFVPHQVVRQLALIELQNAEYCQLPLDHAALLDEVRQRRLREEQCEVLSEVHEAAVQRLIAYSRDSSRIYANARFLNLRVAEQEGTDKTKTTRRVSTDLEAQAACRAMVDQLVKALEQQQVDMTVFKPNHFASLSVSFALLVKTRKDPPKNGLARWC